MKDVPQHGGSQHSRQKNTKEVSKPDLGRVHLFNLTPAKFAVQAARSLPSQ
jgi:hypothetical protein